MAITAPLDFNVDYLRDQVMTTYAHVAREPHADYHFHRGPEYAATFLGYDRQELAALPAAATARFAGVGNPLAIGPVRAGETVLDHACGAGMDLLLAARRVGPSGRAIGIDMTPAMVEQAMWAAAEAGMVDRIEVHRGFYEALPVPDGTVDVVISNGVLNLAPDKGQVLKEIHRVLKPGGRLYPYRLFPKKRMTRERYCSGSAV
jgi:arsenite methyltransferase